MRGFVLAGALTPPRAWIVGDNGPHPLNGLTEPWSSMTTAQIRAASGAFQPGVTLPKAYTPKLDAAAVTDDDKAKATRRPASPPNRSPRRRANSGPQSSPAPRAPRSEAERARVYVGPIAAAIAAGLLSYMKAESMGKDTARPPRRSRTARGNPRASSTAALARSRRARFPVEATSTRRTRRVRRLRRCVSTNATRCEGTDLAIAVADSSSSPPL